jgi:hypothetical protein
MSLLGDPDDSAITHLRWPVLAEGDPFDELAQLYEALGLIVTSVVVPLKE